MQVKPRAANLAGVYVMSVKRALTAPIQRFEGDAETFLVNYGNPPQFT